MDLEDDVSNFGFKRSEQYLSSEGAINASLTWAVDAGTMGGSVDTVFQLSCE